MAEIPVPSCFGISSPTLQPSTPQPASAMSPLPLSTTVSSSSALILSSGVSVASPSQSPLTVPSLHSVVLQPLSVSALSSYSFYLNNFSHLVHNSHTSLPLYDPTGLQVQPPPFTFRRLGYSQLETIADSLVAVNSPVPSSDLVYYTLLGLGWEYETLVTTLTHVPMHLTTDDLRPRLLLQQQRLKAFKDNDESFVSHPALAVHSTTGPPSLFQDATSQRPHQG
ncbi:hypothetical protein Cgig2_018424 [Carnegiea gigantea]|uniref:Uncharacterized protein n=1 Tax=Carnegiea gigantea TaxID=171969 RepID=A0A9Q1GMX0_9CARY|nr:hypothetical protein Cgig2_018424 [Carnegiea gigantea]